MAAGLGHQLRIPGKLNRVAKALFGVNQKRFSLDRNIAKPHRPWKRAVNFFEFRGFPAPLVILKPRREITTEQQGEGAVPVSVCKLGVNRNRGVATFQRRFDLVEVLERNPSVGIGNSVIGFEGDRFGIAGYGLIAVLFGLKRIATV